MRRDHSEEVGGGWTGVSVGGGCGAENGEIG